MPQTPAELHTEEISTAEALRMTEYGQRLAARKREQKTLRMIEVDGVWIVSPERNFEPGGHAFAFKFTFP